MDCRAGSTHRNHESLSTSMSIRQLQLIPGVILLTMTVMAACSGTGAASKPRPTVRPGEFGTAACFYRRSVEDFTVLDQSNLIVYAPNRTNAYHIAISPPEPELGFANTIGFSSRNSEICGYAGDALLLDVAGGRQRVSIVGVYRLDSVALAGLRNRFHIDASATKPSARDAPGSRIDRSLDEVPGAQDKPPGATTK
jgi:hypothetical protein